MPDIRLSNDLMSKVDKIAAEKGMSRNKLVNKIIEKYVEASDSFVSDILPDVVRSIVNDEIKKLDDTSTEVIKDMYVTIIKLRKITETLETFLLPEYNEVDYDTLKTNELLTLIELSEKLFKLNSLSYNVEIFKQKSYLSYLICQKKGYLSYLTLLQKRYLSYLTFKKSSPTLSSLKARYYRAFTQGVYPLPLCSLRLFVHVLSKIHSFKFP